MRAFLPRGHALKTHLGEAQIQRDIMMGVSKAGSIIFRNNVGVAIHDDPRTGRQRRVKYGLHPGSSDLIGWTPYEIRAKDVGGTVAVFTALEVKIPGKNATEGQQRFIDAVHNAGGIGTVVRSLREAVEAVTRFKIRGVRRWQ